MSICPEILTHKEDSEKKNDNVQHYPVKPPEKNSKSEVKPPKKTMFLFN